MIPRPHGVGRCSTEDLYLQVSRWWEFCCRQRRGPGSVWWHLVHHIMPQSLTSVSAYRNQNVIHALRAQLNLWVHFESEGGKKKRKKKKKKRLGWPQLELVHNSQSHKWYEVCMLYFSTFPPDPAPRVHGVRLAQCRTWSMQYFNKYRRGWCAVR